MKELKLDDYSIIKPYLDLANYEGYNSNFVTMMMWNHEYHIQYEIHEHFVVMLHNYKGTQFWAMPFTSPQYYREAIDYMLEYSHKNQFEFIIDCAIDTFVEYIKPLYQDKLLFARTPENDDYVYDRMMLQTLSGKKMQKRRNHYNAFLKENPDYIYRDLDLVNDFNMILECLNRWESEKEDLSESMTSEVKGIMYLLSSRHMLEFEVGGIFINGQMEAFIIASRLKHSTIQIHVEKANKDIRGLYPAILKEMLEHHFPDEQYVNREEDMGLENLKKSKLTLHPIKMNEKNRIYEKDEYIGQASDDDLESIIHLWKDNFPDETEETTNYYFQYLYHKEYTFVLKNKNHLISMLQIVPISIQIHNQIRECYFILGVATKKNFEKQGYMKKLLQFVLEQYNNQIIYLQAYHPEIYKPFGFNASHYHQKIAVDKEKLIQSPCIPIDDISLLKDYYEAFVQQFDEYRIRDEYYWKLFIQRCLVFLDNILIFKDHGYLIYHENDESIEISEFIYLTKDSINIMLSYFSNSTKNIILECDINVEIEGQSSLIITMMSNQVKLDTFDKHKYINEIY